MSNEERLVYMTQADLKEFGLSLIEAVKAESLNTQQQQKDAEMLYNPKDFAKRFNVSTSTLWRWCKQGLLTKTEVGGRVLYKESDLRIKVTNRQKQEVTV